MPRHLLILCALLLPSVALTQNTPAPTAPPYTSTSSQYRQWEILDAGLADRGPLGTSLRRTNIDLRLPTGFEHVYLAPFLKNHLMRVDGGLYAIFPRSQYTDAGFGGRPIIPAGTTFHIGPPREKNAGMAESSDPRPSTPEPDVAPPPRKRLGIRSVVHESSPHDEQAALPRYAPKNPLAASFPSILHDADYRRRRYHELMARAARAQSK